MEEVYKKKTNENLAKTGHYINSLPRGVMVAVSNNPILRLSGIGVSVCISGRARGGVYSAHILLLFPLVPVTLPSLSALNSKKQSLKISYHQQLARKLHG